MPRNHCRNHTLSTSPRMPVGDGSMPNCRRTMLTKPFTEKKAKAIPYTVIQLMKFGSVVVVWTNFLKCFPLISLNRMANTTGRGVDKSPRPLITKVLRITRSTSERSLYSFLKLSRPTKTMFPKSRNFCPNL